MLRRLLVASRYAVLIAVLGTLVAALALLVYFWRDWARIIGGFLSSVRHLRVETASERLAWMIILATIPVGIIGLGFEHDTEFLRHACSDFILQSDDFGCARPATIDDGQSVFRSEERRVGKEC